MSELTASVLGKRKPATDPIPLPRQGAPIPVTRMTELDAIRKKMITGTLTREENSDILQAVFEVPATVPPAPCDLGPGETDRCHAALIEKLRTIRDPRIFAFVQEFLKLKNTHRPTKNTAAAAAAISAMTHIPLCVREHNRHMLRTPKGVERQCGMGEKCLALKQFGRCLREFLLPDEEREIVSHGRRAVEPENRSCLICIRDAYHAAHLFAHFSGAEHTPNQFAQYFKNAVNVPGEYSMLDCFSLLTGFSLPIVMNLWAFYEASTDSDNVMWISEKHYASPNF